MEPKKYFYQIKKVEHLF